MSQRLKILWLKSGPLHPLDTGGKIRTYNMLRELMRNHEVTFVALCPEHGKEPMAAAAEYSHRQVWIPWQETRKRTPKFFLELASNFLFSAKPYVIEKYFSRNMARQLFDFDSSGQFDLIICDFLTPAVNLFSKRSKLQTPALLFQHNVESLIWKRLYENATGIKRAYFKRQWRRMEDFERETCGRCDTVVGVSEDDCRILKNEFGLSNVLGAVPTGVDLSYFSASSQPRKPHSLVFLGSMDWMPNIDAVSYFTGEMWEALRGKFPNVTFTIAGRNPTPGIKEMEKPGNGICVTGTVPDVRPKLAEAEVMIVPLRIGGGTRIKIYEGMAAGIPIVSTTIGAEGLPVTHRENILIADSPAAFQDAVAELFQDASLRKKIGENGRALVQERFGWESVGKVFERYCFETRASQKRQISAL